MIMTDLTTHKRTYKFRAECSADATIIKALLAAYILVWIEIRDDDSTPDVQVTFAVREDAPSLEWMRDYIHRVNDLHVAAESLQESKNYTGVRTEVEEIEHKSSLSTMMENYDTAKFFLEGAADDIKEAQEDLTKI